ncbi:putative hydrolase of the HAD superfamily [Paenisporosarcina quisquiliarum]|nr:putative hydrolase of the HAD superfamily [Paenisporosarcina quisquiliarum]
MIKVVVFDMDDTLFLEQEYVLSGFYKIDQFLESKGIIGFYNKAIDLFNSGVRGNIFNEVLDYFSIPYSIEDINVLVEIYRNHTPNIRLLEEAEWAISQLIPQYKLGLITDGYLNAQKNKAEALRLAEYFHNLIFTDQFGREYWKPSEKPYIEMKKFFDVEHQELVYIGDNPSKDFITAKRLGWKTIHIVRENSEYCNLEFPNTHQADYKISSLYELPKLIEKL